ncbi:MAG TPA: hypothetical protein VGX71_13710 [Pseudaminobacter sp.]|nr:hypothetical protein [Pseudaminobacter sp.]
MEINAYTIKSFMSAYPIKRSRLYEEINSGRLCVKRAGRRVLIGKDAADTWFNSLPDGTNTKGASSENEPQAGK